MIGEANGWPIILLIATAAIMTATVMGLCHAVITLRARWHTLNAGLFFKTGNIDRYRDRSLRLNMALRTRFAAGFTTRLTATR